MGTTVYECGCSITRSMYGDYRPISVQVCEKHAGPMAELLHDFLVGHKQGEEAADAPIRDNL